MAVGDGPFHAMTDGTPAQWQAIAAGDRLYAAALADRVLTQLEMLADSRHGFAIDRLQHCLQSATRAANDGRDDEYVVCALLHDIGDVLAPANHAEYAALVLRPYVSERNLWMILHHGDFQGYYFNHFFGEDRNVRDRFKQHRWFEHTAEFCELYDQCAFDPGYPTAGLGEFVPIVRRVLAVDRRDAVVAE